MKPTYRSAESLRFKCFTIHCEEAATSLLSQIQHFGICARNAMVLISLLLTTMDVTEVCVTYSKITPTTLDRDNKCLMMMSLDVEASDDQNVFV